MISPPRGDSGPVFTRCVISSRALPAPAAFLPLMSWLHKPKDSVEANADREACNYCPDFTVKTLQGSPEKSTPALPLLLREGKKSIKLTHQ